MDRYLEGFKVDEITMIVSNGGKNKEIGEMKEEKVDEKEVVDDNVVMIWYEFDKENEDHVNMLKKGTVIRTPSFEETLVYVGSNHGFYINVGTNESCGFSLLFKQVKEIGVPVKKSCSTCRYNDGYCIHSGGICLMGGYQNWEPILKPGMKMYVRSNAKEIKPMKDRYPIWVDEMYYAICDEVTLVCKPEFKDCCYKCVMNGESSGWSYRYFEDPNIYKTMFFDLPADELITMNVSFTGDDEIKTILFSEMKPGDKGVIVEGPEAHIGETVLKTIFNSIILIDSGSYDGWEEEDANHQLYKVRLFDKPKEKEEQKEITICLDLGDDQEIDYSNYTGLTLTSYWVDECIEYSYEESNKIIKYLKEDVDKRKKEQTDKEKDRTYYFKAVNDFYGSFTKGIMYKLKEDKRGVEAGWETTSNFDELGFNYTWAKNHFKSTFGEDIYDRIEEIYETILLFKEFLIENDCYEEFYERCFIEYNEDIDNWLREEFCDGEGAYGFCLRAFAWPCDKIEYWGSIDKRWKELYKEFKNSKTKEYKNKEAEELANRRKKAEKVGEEIKEKIDQIRREERVQFLSDKMRNMEAIKGNGSTRFVSDYRGGLKSGFTKVNHEFTFDDGSKEVIYI